MKHSLKKLIAISLCAAMLGTAAASFPSVITDLSITANAYEAYGDYQYEIMDDGTAKIVKYNGSDRTVIIPSEIDGHSVTIIYNGAFQSRKNLVSVTIPDGVTLIGTSAFYSCENLEEISIPDSVTYIGSYAFCGCQSLDSVTLPKNLTTISDGLFQNSYYLKNVDLPENLITINKRAFEGCIFIRSMHIPAGVKSIGKDAFSDCTRLNDLTVDSRNNYYTAEDNVLFDKDKTELIFCIKFKSGKYVIPDTVKTIADNAFESCGLLTEIIIPDSVETIGEYSFNSCNYMPSITIPDSVVSIGKEAFGYCTSLNTVNIPQSVSFIGDGAFRTCSKLENVEFLSKADISVSMFNDCKKLKELVIPYGVKKIGDSAFQGCEELVTLKIPNTVTAVGNSVFYGCTKLNSLTIPPQVSEIGYQAAGYTGYNTKNEDFVIYGAIDSAAQMYAKDEGFSFVVSQEFVKGLENTSVINSTIVQVGDKVRVSASAKDGTGGYTYAYYYKRSSNTSWKKLGTEFGTDSSVSFTPTAEADFDVKVIVQDSSGAKAEKLFIVKAVKELALKNVSVLQRTNIKLGTAVPMIGRAVGGSAPYTYKYQFRRSTNANWKTLGNGYTKATTARLKPTAKGMYDVRIDDGWRQRKIVNYYADYPHK